MKACLAMACLGVFLLVGGLPPANAAQTNRAAQLVLLQEATELYRQGLAQLDSEPEAARDQLRGALLRYERLQRLGARNGKLFYNIGNVHFALGDPGRALLNYRRAARYLGDDPRLVRNLGLLKARLPETAKEERQDLRIPSVLAVWHQLLPLGALRWIFGLSYCLGFVLLGHAILGRRRAGLTPWTAATLGVAGLLFASLYVAQRAALGQHPGVVVEGGVVLRQGDGEQFPPLAGPPLAGGSEFELLASRGGWYQIRLADGRQGWIRARSAGLVNNDVLRETHEYY